MSNVPPAQPRPGSGWQAPPGGHQPQGGPPPPPPGAGWQQQPAPGPQYPPPPPGSAQGRGYTIASFICAVIALVFFPVVLGPLGAVLGYVGHRKGDPAGKWALIASIAALVLGMIIGLIVFSTVD